MSAQHFSGVADHRIDLRLGKCARERRHAVAPIAHDRRLILRIGKGVDDGATERRPDPAPAIGAVAVHTSRPEHVASEHQHGVLVAIRPCRNLGRRARTGTGEEHCEEHDSKSRGQGGARHATDDTECMGMDPTRPHKRRPTDILFVGAGVLVAVLLVLWAMFG